jgi:hypothetical protein
VQTDLALRSPRYCVSQPPITASRLDLPGHHRRRDQRRPGVTRRKKRLAEIRSEIELCRRRGEEAAHLLKVADDLTPEIVKTLRLAMQTR